MGSEDLKFVIEMVDKASAQITELQNHIEGLEKTVNDSSGKVNSSFSSMGKSVLTYAAGFASIGVATSFLKDSVAEALEAERAHGQLKRQVESTGVSWSNYGQDIQKAVQSAAKYALVQDEEVSRALSRMVLVTGDVKGSVDNLRLALDLATARGMDFEQASMLVGKAMEGDIGTLARFMPELKNLESTLGENATASDKSAAALSMLEERVGGSAGTMGEGTKAIKEFQMGLADFKEYVGTGILPILGDMFKGFSIMGGAVRDAMKWLAGDIDKMAEKSGALVKVEQEITAVQKAMSQVSATAPPEYMQKLQGELDRLVAKKTLLEGVEKRITEAYRGQGTTVNKLNELTSKKIVGTEALKKAGEEEKARLEKLNGLYGSLNTSLVSLGSTEADYLTGKIMENRALFKTSEEIERYVQLLQEELNVKKEIKLQAMVEKEGMTDISPGINPEQPELSPMMVPGITTTFTPEALVPPTFGEQLRTLYNEHIQTPTAEMLEVSLGALTTFSDGVGNAFGQAIIYGESLSEAFSGLMKKIAAEIIAGLVKVGVQQLLSWALGKAILTAQSSAQLAAASAATFAGVTAWAAPMLGPGAIGVAKATTAAMLGGAKAAGAVGGALGKTFMATGGATPMAKGGIVTSPTIALVGEAGPEAVVPLSGKNAPPMGNVSITFTGPVMGDLQQARQFAQMIDAELFTLKNKGLSLAFSS